MRNGEREERRNRGNKRLRKRYEQHCETNANSGTRHAQRSRRSLARLRAMEFDAKGKASDSSKDTEKTVDSKSDGQAWLKKKRELRRHFREKYFSGNTLAEKSGKSSSSR